MNFSTNTLVIAATLGAMTLTMPFSILAQKKAKASSSKETPVKSVITPSVVPQPIPDPVASEAECKTILQTLASDAFKGRKTGEAGNNEAAAYIANHFKSFGLLPVSQSAGSVANPYFQPIEFRQLTPPKAFTLVLGKDTLRMGIDAIMTSGDALQTSTDAVYVGFGIVDTDAKRDDYAGANVQGKIVVAKIGANDSTKPQEAFSLSRRKRDIALGRGALAFIEIMNLPSPPAWARLNELARRPLLQAADAPKSPMPVFFIKDLDKRITAQFESLAAAKKTLSVSVQTSGMATEAVFSQNVVGLLRGTDSTLSKEYIILSAHYDHLGFVTGTGQKDSIFNGARDNAMGTTAVIAAAKAFAAKPPARSILFIAFTGEEMGLLGSRYYAEHPLMPLNNAVYNLNIDGAGFNDTTLVTVIGLERTTAKNLIEEGTQKLGLTAKSDPAPEQNLFDRSDNVSFAAKGIPAPTFSPGFTAFDASIIKYYHQLADEAGEDFNFSYMTKFVNAYIVTSRLIANAKERPHWIQGDKYEAAYKGLYSTK